MNNQKLILIGLIAIVMLSGCTDNRGARFEEIVKVIEVKTETTETGLIRYYFKSNSSITNEWIEARIKDAFFSRWIVVSVNDIIELFWYRGSNGISLRGIGWISKGE